MQMKRRKSAEGFLTTAILIGKSVVEDKNELRKYYIEIFECPHFTNLLVGAGSARPNTSTDISVGAFGQADPAPTGWHFAVFIRIKGFSEAGKSRSIVQAIRA